MKRITCSQCDSGPQEGSKGKVCEWKGHIRSPGAKACEYYFLSSANSDLCCKRCSGQVEMTDVKIGDNLCCKCREAKEGIRAGYKRAVCIMSGLLFFGVVGVAMAIAGRMLRWW
jgi:hypothetical protein